MTLAEHLKGRPPDDARHATNLISRLANCDAFHAESRLPEEAWQALVDGLLTVPATAAIDEIRSKIKGALAFWHDAAPEAEPDPAFLERVGDAWAAVESQRYHGVTREAVEEDWDDFLSMVKAGNLDGIRDRFKNLIVGLRPVWATPFGDIAARPFDGIPILLLCQRLALGRTPKLDGNDWILCYEGTSALPCRVPTMTHACGGSNWHDPFFPVPAGQTFGQTRPTDPAHEPFFEVVHGPVSWQCLVALPENRTT